jgi:hypothetical protein
VDTQLPGKARPGACRTSGTRRHGPASRAAPAGKCSPSLRLRPRPRAVSAFCSWLAIDAAARYFLDRLTEPATEPSRALAYYLWPPRWVDRLPDWDDIGGGVVRPDELGELVTEVTLPGGTRVRVFRDGEFAFMLGPSEPKYLEAFMDWQQRCLRLMNAHLACLHTVLPVIFNSAIATLWTAMQVTFETGAFSAGTFRADGGAVLALHSARRPQSLMGGIDWRYSRPSSIVVSKQQLSDSFDLLGDLLAHPRSEVLLVRAEMLLRAKVALSDMDYTGCLTNAWTACEAMLGDLLQHYLDEVQDRDVGQDDGGQGLRFITRARREFLTGQEMTVRHTMEVLSLLERLPFDLYRDLRVCSTARNNWLHKEQPPTNETAHRALRAAGSLFELLEGIPLNVLGTRLLPA